MESVPMPIDVRGVAPAGVQYCEIEVFPPAGTAAGSPADPVVAFCLPGGGFSRRYFDLDIPAEVGDYSMARALAARGHLVVTCDPPGVGESDVPADPFTLSPETLADVQAAVTATVLERLAAGTLTDALAPLPRVHPIGVGHSAGALLTVYQQARHRQNRGLVLLGFAGRGLPGVLTAEERAFTGDPEGFRAARERLVSTRFGDPLPRWEGGTSGLFAANAVMPEAVRAGLRRAQAPLLTLLGLTAMVPGAAAAELAAIDVPVFLGVGSRDITGPPQAIPGDLPNAPEVTLFVLDGAGHTHNAEPNRHLLWDRLATWAEARAATRRPSPRR